MKPRRRSRGRLRRANGRRRRYLALVFALIFAPAVARRAAGDRDVQVLGGAHAAQQYLRAGLVDEMEINLVPTLLGDGERLFDGVGDDLHGLALVRTVAAPNVTHLKYARR